MELISDPAVPLCYSKTSWGHRTEPGPETKTTGGKLRYVSCFVTEIFYLSKLGLSFLEGILN